MKKEFENFLDNITLTSKQKEDAKTKYTNVCEKLYSHFYEGKYDDSKKFLFGSYKTKTNIRPLSHMQDVDVLFKIPQEIFDKYDSYESNGQEALLQEVRNTLKERYTTTDVIKAWGKVVLIQFEENHHNVELLPALELDDKKFKIPNSADGGYWNIFDPRAEIEKFEKSNEDSGGLTRNLAKMLKSWAHNNTTMQYQSYRRLNDVIKFLKENYSSATAEVEYDKIIFNFFDYMNTRCDTKIKSFIETALSHARKALEYSDDDKFKEASEEWRKIFGDKFPFVKENPQKESYAEEIISPARPWSN